MSYLIRTGNGRNNIAWGGSKSTKAKYLRRTGTGRANISWIDISSNGTYNVLERTSSGRNNIRWYNTTFNFISFDQIVNAIGDDNFWFEGVYDSNGISIECAFGKSYTYHVSNINGQNYLITESRRFFEATSGSLKNVIVFYIGNRSDHDDVWNMIKQMKKISIAAEISGPYGEDNFTYYKNLQITDFRESSVGRQNSHVEFSSSNFKMQSGEYYRVGFRFDP